MNLVYLISILVFAGIPGALIVIFHHRYLLRNRKTVLIAVGIFWLYTALTDRAHLGWKCTIFNTNCLTGINFLGIPWEEHLFGIGIFFAVITTTLVLSHFEDRKLRFRRNFFKKGSGDGD